MEGFTLRPFLKRRRNKRFASVLGVLLAAGAFGLAADKTPEAADAARVTAVRFWSLGGVTRVAIEVSSEFHFKYEHLSNPDRLYFDIFSARPDMARRGMQAIRVDDGVVRQIRVAETQPGVTRVVVDLRQPAGLSTSQLSNPDRLMIEVKSEEKLNDKPPTQGVSGSQKPSEPAHRTEATLASVKPSSSTSSSALSSAPPAPRNVAPIQPVADSAKAAPLVKVAAPRPPVETARVNETPKPVESAKSAEPPKSAESNKFAELNKSGEAKSREPVASVLKTATAVVSRTVPAEKIAEKPIAAAASPAELHKDSTESKPTADKAPTVVATLPPEPLGVEPPARRDDIQAVLPAKRGTVGDRSLTRALGLKLERVVIDPGHGGHDVGTHGPSGYYEKDLSLDVAHRLAALVQERMGSEVILTRTEDNYVALEERTRIANDRKADLFLSIHANSSSYRAAAGVETYILNFTTSKSAMDLAARENAGSDLAIHDLQDLLQKIALRDKIEESQELAASLQTSLSMLSTRSNDAAKNRGVKKAPFVVLIGATMPSVLAEIGFLSNTSDEALLRKPEHRQKIAEALYKGIASYADTLSHLIARQN